MFFKPFLFFTFIATLLLSLGCATTPTEENKKESSATQHKPKKIIIRANTQIDSTAAAGETVQKNIIQITISPKKIFLDSRKIKNIKKLKRLLKKYDKPVITISAHKCANAALTTQIMNLAQDQTNTPILYSSYGKFTDPACK